MTASKHKNRICFIQNSVFLTLLFQFSLHPHTFLHGSGCCIRTMPYSIPKTVRVITASHLHPVALCSYYQIFHLHRACPNMEISTTFLQTAKYDVATLIQRNKETIRVKERRRADPYITELQKGSYEKTWLGEKQT